MLFGAHVSIAGGFYKAPERAEFLGCEVFQIFSRSPRGGNPPKITASVARDFKSAREKFKQSEFYIHTPYYINFASSKKRISFGSIEIIKTELERASVLGASAVMTHLGSAKDLSLKSAISQTVFGIAKALKNYKGSSLLLLELSAGSGAIIGSCFEEMSEIIIKAERVLKRKNFIGVCLDTAHAFASGYDLRDKKSVDKIIKSFDKTIGLNRLKLIHANDSKVDLDSKKDRHEHIGKGKIGKKGFEALVKNPKLKNINMIVETPSLEGMKKDIILLKKLRGK